jgi:Calcineurin-like phosphoesterase/Carboxypeptidase regulatory-like domain
MSRAVFGLALILLSCCLSAAQVVPPDFTIVVLPDTQFYSANHPDIFTAQTKWILSHMSSLNIKAVVGVGDIVNGGGEPTQWRNADFSVSFLEHNVPYFLAIGNHDYNANNPPKRTAAATNFNKYFGPARYANTYSGWKGSFPKGSNENFYATLTIEGHRYLFLVLEFYPRSTSLQWASSIISANPDKEVIVVTHSYEYFDNTRVALCDNYNAESYGMGADNDGEDMWTGLVRRFPNVSLVLSGHITRAAGQMATGRRTEVGLNGNIVNQILSNYQAMANGGEGYLRIMTFRRSLNRIDVSTYSPYLLTSLTDSTNKFAVRWHRNGSTGTGSISGRVRNRSCGGIAGAKVSWSGGSTTTNSTGSFSLSSVPAGNHTLTVQATGYTSLSKTISVGPGLTANALYFLPPK